MSLAVAVLFLSAAPAQADFFFTPFAAVKFAGSSRLFDPDSGASNAKFTLGGIGGFLGSGLLGVEGDVSYTPRFFERSTGRLVARSHVLTVMGNVIVATPRSVSGYSLRPFVSGGAGLMHINIDDIVDALGTTNNLFGVNVGGGATGPLSNALDVRFEVRWFKSVSPGEETTLRPGTALNFWRAAVGLTVR